MPLSINQLAMTISPTPATKPIAVNTIQREAFCTEPLALSVLAFK
jgi:hypothetical protein